MNVLTTGVDDSKLQEKLCELDGLEMSLSRENLVPINWAKWFYRYLPHRDVWQVWLRDNWQRRLQLLIFSTDPSDQKNSNPAQ